MPSSQDTYIKDCLMQFSSLCLYKVLVCALIFTKRVMFYIIGVSCVSHMNAFPLSHNLTLGLNHDSP